MMLMKTPTAGGAAGTGGGRDVIFRLQVQPDSAAPAKMRTWGESMRREQALFATDAKRAAREWEDNWTRALNSVVEKTRAASQRMAADLSGAMRSFGGGPGGGPGIAGGPMSMGMLGGASYSRDPMNMAAMAQANLTQMQRLAAASARNNPMNMAALAGAGGINWGISGGSLPGRGGSRPTDAFGGGFNRSAEGFNNLIHGGMNLARGAAYSGLAGEEDSGKLVSTLLKVEGTMGLLYGAISMAKGANALGMFAGMGAFAAPAAAGIAAIGGGLLGGNAIREQMMGTAMGDKSQSMMTARGLVHAGSWIERASWAMNPFADESTASTASGYTQSVLRRNEQMKKATGLQKARLGRMNSDDEFAAEQFGASNQDMKRFGMGMSLAKNDETRLFLVGKQLQADRQRLQGFRDREASAAPGVERDNFAKSRLDMEGRVIELAKQEEEIRLRTGQEALNLSRERATSEAGIARQAADAQMGIAQTLGGQVRSDSSRLGSMNALEKARLMAAATAFRGGHATLEQEERLSGLNAFRDKVDAARAKRGEPLLRAIAPEAVADAHAAAAEAEKRLAAANAAQLNVVTQHKLQIEVLEGKGFKMDMEKQIMQFVVEEIKRKDIEYKRAMDDLKREINMREKAKQVVAGK